MFFIPIAPRTDGAAPHSARMVPDYLEEPRAGGAASQVRACVDEGFTSGILCRDGGDAAG